MEAGEQKIKICKICKAAIKNGTKSLPVTVTAKAEAPAAEESATKTAAAEAPAETAAEEKAEE
jgi:hypothetical protein